MSRSNRNDHLPNPATRWFEWGGENGGIRYYDKTKKENVDVPLPFTFMLLDQLSSVRGWHEESKSGIYSNEVRDVTQDAMVVKSFKGGTIEEGKYRVIKDRVKAAGGRFVANCYIAYKNGDGLKIGSLRLKGAALGAWMEFGRSHRGAIYDKAIKIDGYTEGKKGRVTYRVPAMKIVELSADTDAQVIGLDQDLQRFLTGYLKRNKRDQADDVAARHITDEYMAAEATDYDHVPPHTDDDFEG